MKNKLKLNRFNENETKCFRTFSLVNYFFWMGPTSDDVFRVCVKGLVGEKQNTFSWDIRKSDLFDESLTKGVISSIRLSSNIFKKSNWENIL